MSTRDFTFSGRLTAAADQLADATSSDCIWSDAISVNNSFSGSTQHQQHQLARFQALRKLPTATSTTTTSNSTGEYQLTSRIPLNSSLALNTSSILGFDSDATNSSASSSCTLNTSSNSLQGSSILLEKDNNNARQTLSNSRQQKSKHLLELQREIKEEADEIFADIDSLINNRSSLYLNADDIGLEEENPSRALSISSDNILHARLEQTTTRVLPNSSVVPVPKLVTTSTTNPAPVNNHLSVAHNLQHSSSSNSLQVQSVPQYHSPTITSTTANTTPTSAGTPNLQADETLFTTDGDKDFFDNFQTNHHQTSTTSNESNTSLANCSQTTGLRPCQLQTRINQSPYASSGQMVSSINARQSASILGCMQHEDGIRSYPLLSNQDDDVSTTNCYLRPIDGGSSDNSQHDDYMKQQDVDDDDDEEVRYTDEHGFNPCNRFTGQQQQQQNYQDVQKVIQQVTNNLPKPCVFFLEGNCRRSDCKYSHDLSSITCKYWIEGFCFKGEMCPFSHSYTPADPQDMLEGDEEGMDSLSKRELNPTFVIESEADFPSLPLDAPNAPLSDNTQGNIKANASSKNLKNKILGSNPAVVFKTVKKKRKKG